MSKSRDQKQTLWLRMDKLIRLRDTIDGNLIGRDPTHVQTDTEPEGWILGFDWGMRASSTYWINELKMIKTRDANKITRLMGLTIMQASKDFKNNSLLRIFGRSNGISKTFLKYTNQLGMSGYSISARIIRRGIQVTKNSKAVSSKDSRNNRENYGVSCSNKINRETLYE